MRVLIALLIFGSGVARADELADEGRRLGVAIGAGMEFAAWRGINPEFYDYTQVPQAFARVNYGEFAALLEYARAPGDESQSGGLRIATTQTSMAAWARYQFRQIAVASPYVALGGGARFENIRTTFAGSVDERRGVRRFVGLGLGVSQTFWSRMVVEGEARVTSEEASKFPGVNFVLRLGLLVY